MSSPTPTGWTWTVWQTKMLGRRGLDAFQVGRLLKKHDFTHGVLALLGGDPLDEWGLRDRMARFGYKWARAAKENPRLALEALSRFVALLASARDPESTERRPRPLVHIEAHLWVRPVSRVLAGVERGAGVPLVRGRAGRRPQGGTAGRRLRRRTLPRAALAVRGLPSARAAPRLGHRAAAGEPVAARDLLPHLRAFGLGGAVAGGRSAEAGDQPAEDLAGGRRPGQAAAAVLHLRDRGRGAGGAERADRRRAAARRRAASTRCRWWCWTARRAPTGCLSPRTRRTCRTRGSRGPSWRRRRPTGPRRTTGARPATPTTASASWAPRWPRWPRPR